jgi:hypothetical protein
MKVIQWIYGIGEAFGINFASGLFAFLSPTLFLKTMTPASIENQIKTSQNDMAKEMTFLFGVIMMAYGAMEYLAFRYGDEKKRRAALLVLLLGDIGHAAWIARLYGAHGGNAFQIGSNLIPITFLVTSRLYYLIKGEGNGKNAKAQQ